MSSCMSFRRAGDVGSTLRRVKMAVALSAAMALGDLVEAFPALGSKGAPASSENDTPWPAIDPSRPMTAAELEELAAYDQETHPEYYHRSSSERQVAASAAFWPGDLMWFVGTSALRYGLNKGFDAGMEHIMPGKPDPTAAALEQISDQLDGLRDQIQGVSDQVFALGDQVEELKQLHEWEVYFDRERDVETQKANIHLYSDLIAGYERHQQWDEQKARAAVSVSLEAINQMEVKLVNGTDPAFQNLQKVLRYSESDTRWAQIDAYRRSYDAVLATGVLNIMAAHDKYPGLFQSELDAAVVRYERAVDGLFEVGGVAYPQPMRFRTDGPAVQAGVQLNAVGEPFVVASPSRPLLRGETKIPLTDRSSIEAAIQPLMDDYYRGKDPSDESFASYLQSLGFPFMMAVADTVQVSEPWPGQWKVHWEDAIVQRRTIAKGFGIIGTAYSSQAEAQEAAAKKREQAIANAPYLLDVETNPAGHAISSDVDALGLAMEGAPIDWNPDGGNGGADLGTLTIEHWGYDALVFVDAVTGVRLGVFDVSQGPIEGAVVKSPESGALALVLGESVQDAPLDEGYVVPVGTMLVNVDVDSNGAGELVFGRISRAVERLHLVLEGPLAENGKLYVAGQMCDGRVSRHCTFELSPTAGNLQVRWDGGPYSTLDRWGGACSGTGWTKCWVDPAHGEQTVTARFSPWSPPY